ncbi:hypothetical protein LTR36_010960 [Oleoguttula mirabilis]|uniref:Uncharacterized protein n=1 Tax=Oleoguttula mirabilis TaxID=1507867 RepID=A0AAV9J3D5_9PEZI|nr:hypothetical protein LTR36_010960 [Oleoguttula mirabilis]
MTSVPRDPAFWKRFSYAVHMDEEKAPEVQQSDSWLGRQQRKRSRRASYICCAFWIFFLLFIAGVVAVVIWLLKSGVLKNVKIGGSSETADQAADPNSAVSSSGKRDVGDLVVEGVLGEAASRLLRLRYRGS